RFAARQIRLGGRARIGRIRPVDVEPVDLVAARLVGLAQHEEEGARLALLLAEAGETQHPNHLGASGAVDDLATGHPAPRPETDAIDLPALVRPLDRLGE